MTTLSKSIDAIVIRDNKPVKCRLTELFDTQTRIETEEDIRCSCCGIISAKTYSCVKHQKDVYIGVKDVIELYGKILNVEFKNNAITKDSKDTQIRDD